MGLVTPEPSAAAAFYAGHLGMAIVSRENGIELSGGLLRLFLDPGAPRPLVLELLTCDLLEARLRLKGFGFEEIAWKGPGGSNLVRDPFGYVFNIYSSPSTFESPEVELTDSRLVKPFVGGLLLSPGEAADFYGELLCQAPDLLPDRSVAIESGLVRLRFRQAPVSQPALWLTSLPSAEDLVALGFKEVFESVFVDPFGLAWCHDRGAEDDRAVVTPL
ncbi:MAG: hypothetical protein KIT11_06350 [Fimbriimonadaceae bacterium]|nr:hypothetical protein [Fimbriimonadaceae bacterium]QYK55978.1 MAG: hypothetical protein KF733_00540 [Fimbriimonadaceae bacterium]